MAEYYGQPTYERVFRVNKVRPFVITLVVLSPLFILLPHVGILLVGIAGVIAGGGMSFQKGELICSPCLKCGCNGNVTNIDDKFLGFQCENCKSFWKKGNKKKLSMSKVLR